MARVAMFWVAGLTVLIGLVHVQLPLFESNQNTYFLHGLAASLPGLAHDWLAATGDPQPVFSALLSLSEAALGPRAVFAWMAFLTCVYGAALFAIAQATWRPREGFALVLGCAFVVALHAGREGELHRRLFHGLAGHYVLGDYLQPSVFGVFLLVALAAALHQRPWLAVASLVVAPTVHPTYALHTVVLAVAIALHWAVFEKQPRHALVVLAGTALGMLPIVIYVAREFGSADSQLGEQAACLLTQRRFPHHAQPTIWFDDAARVTVAVGFVTVAAMWKRPVGKILAFVCSVSAGLIALQLLGGPSCRLAALFPARASVYVAPVVTTLWLVGAASLLGRIPWRARELCAAAAALVTLLAVARGVEGWRTFPGFKRTGALFTAITRHVPEEGTLLMAPPGLRPDVRLMSGRSLVVDHKSHPYEASEVNEWWRRLQFADAFARRPTPEQLEQARQRYRVTHLLLGARVRPPAGCQLQYRDRRHQLLACPNGPTPAAPPDR
jgi:hypothetical protein